MLSYPQYPSSFATLVATGGWQVTFPTSGASGIIGQQYKQITVQNGCGAQIWFSLDQINQTPVPASSNASGLLCNIGQGATVYMRNDSPSSAAVFQITLGP